MESDKLRSAIPALEQGIYLNAAWSGPCSRGVLRAVGDYLAAEASDGPTSARGYARRAGVDRQARADLAWLLNCDPIEIALTDNTTEGINIVFNGLPWRTGDRLVISNMEHPSVLLPALYAMRRHGIDLRVAAFEAPAPVQAAVDAFDRAIEPGTRLVAVSHVAYTNGTRFPLAEIVEIAHQRGAMVVADGAQALGQIAVDVRALGVDFYAGPGQKWLCGPDGTGVLYVRHDRILDLAPVKFGYWSATAYQSTGELVENLAEARRFEVSTTNGGLWAGLSRAIETVRRIGPAAIEEHSTRLASYALGRLLSVPGVRIVGPREGPALTGLVCFRVEGVEPDAVTATLWERARITAGGRQDRSGRRVEYTESTRLSLAFYNTEQDIDRVIDLVEDLARHGAPPVEGGEWWQAMHGG